MAVGAALVSDHCYRLLLFCFSKYGYYTRWQHEWPSILYLPSPRFQHGQVFWTSFERNFVPFVQDIVHPFRLPEKIVRLPRRGKSANSSPIPNSS